MSLLIINIPLIFLWYFLSKLLIKKDKEQDMVFLVLSGLQLFFFHAFKDWNTLPDLDVYNEIFLDYVHYDNIKTYTERTEIGYKFLNYLISRFSNNIIVFSLIISFFIVFSYTYTIYKYSQNYFISVFLFICMPYLQSLFVLRQHIAIAICLYTIPSILQRKFIPFLFLTTIAFFFHKTAIIFYLSYFIYKVNLKNNFIKKLIIIVVISTAFMRIMIIFITNHISIYSHYLEDPENGTNITTALMGLCIIIVSLLFTNYKELKGCNKLCFIMICTYALISIAGIGFPLIPRLVNYYSVFIILWIPNMLFLMHRQYRIVFTPIIMLFYFLLFYTKIASTDMIKYKLIV